jgi:hypothetical protein
MSRDPLQIVAVATAVGHLALLAGVFFSSAIQTRAYVSTEIHSALFFKVLLTLVVLTEGVVSMTYICVIQHALGETLGLLASLLVLAATAGWAILATFAVYEQEHEVGAAIYIVTTSLYSFYFMVHAKRGKVVGIIFWTASTALACAFGSLYYGYFYDEAALVEWACFSLYALTLLIFFSLNPPSLYTVAPPPASKV